MKTLFYIGLAILISPNIFGSDSEDCIKKIECFPAPLDNEKCTAKNPDGTKQRVFRPRTSDEDIHGILLHYTVCQSLESTYSAYYGAGVSAHFTLDQGGKVFYNVHTKNIAFHAGESFFAGESALNRHFIGIEHINPGFVEPKKTYLEEFGTPCKIEGDGRLWFPFSEPQFLASVAFTLELQKIYKIPGWSVLTHADVAVGRKSDIGPMYDYKKASTEFGAGYYPEDRTISLTSFSALEDSDYENLVHIIGYKSKSGKIVDEIKAFQMHYSTTNISGELLDCTKKSILCMCIDLYKNTDELTGLKNDRFIANFGAWKEDKGTLFDEFL